MTENERIIWAAAFAQVFNDTRDVDMATLKASDAVTALHIAMLEVASIKPSKRRDRLVKMAEGI